jgi:hypothetical protein
MGALAIGILALTLAGALASWIVAAVYGMRALGAANGANTSRWRRFAVLAWPFAVSRFKGAASEHAAIVNKAVVAFFVCVTLAMTTISLATNLNRIAK